MHKKYCDSKKIDTAMNTIIAQNYSAFNHSLRKYRKENTVRKQNLPSRTQSNHGWRQCSWTHCCSNSHSSCAPFFRAPKGALYTERNFPLFRPGTHNTKAAVVVAVERVAVDPAGDSAVGRIVAPAATAYDAERTRRGTSGRCARAYEVIPVPALLPDVTAHVVQA